MKQLEPSPVVDAARKTLRQVEMDVLVGYILLCGVLLSLALEIVGLGWRWLDTGNFSFGYRIINMNLFQFVVSEVHSAVVGTIRPRLFINLGIVALMLTPYLRVAASTVYFVAVLRNWKYALFTSFVLVVLTVSLFLRHY